MQQRCLGKGNGMQRGGAALRQGHRMRKSMVPFAGATAAPVQQKPAASTEVKLPDSLRNNVAVLQAPNPSAPGGKTDVYLLAMSHVSKKSVDQVRELIKLVRPEVVVVELCKERCEFLVDPEAASKPSNIWHSRKTRVEGLPEDPDWPTAAELKPLLMCRSGRPVTVRDIEADVYTLLGTGLFKSVRPVCDAADRNEVPEYSVTLDADGRPALQLVPPLGAIRFIVTERSLPAVAAMAVRLDSSIKAAGVDQTALEGVAEQAVEECRKGGSAMAAYLRTKKRFAALFPGQKVAVAFSGVETGRVEATVKAVKASDPPYTSGLEGSAINGEGFGIDVFRPMRNLFKVSNKMFVPSERIDLLKAERRAEAAAVLAGDDAPVEAAAAASSSSHASSNGNGADVASHSGRVSAQGHSKAVLRPWSEEEMAAAKPDDPPVKGAQDSFARFLNSTYARIQSRAGRTLGVPPGEAWRAAMEAATEVGCSVLVLGDRPTTVTGRRLADNMAGPSGGLVGVALALVLGTLVGMVASDALPPTTEFGIFLGSIAAAMGVAWPVLSPLFEISRFADMSGEEVEDAVAVKQPIDQGDLSQPLKLFGEDALLGWPGAMRALIDERDLFMAKAVAAVAEGKAGVAPAYVLDEVDGLRVWRYAMPDGAPARSAPQGFGDGALQPLGGVRAVVGVIGSAHVRGMVREWRGCVEDTGVDALLKDEE